MTQPPSPPTRDTPVSVLLPAHNAAAYVEEAVRSVLGQTHRHIELIVIDDGSTDRTPTILRRLAQADSRVRVISHANMGMGRSLNKAIELARHDWLARIDADDLMEPQRLERQLEFARQHPQLVVMSSLVTYINSEGRPIGRSLSDYVDAKNVQRTFANGQLVGFHHPAVLMWRPAVREVGGYRPQFWPCDDQDLWNRLLEVHPDGLLVQPEALTCYRVHASSICVRSARRVQQMLEWVEWCARARRRGSPEPTLEQYLACRRRTPWIARLGQARREHARTFFKSAAIHFANRHLVRAATPLALAAMLEPEYVFRRLLPQIRHNLDHAS